ncbi:MAG: DEAD/DEAH box helicase, partial [Candidatus Sungiibacteriota bacterium]
MSYTTPEGIKELLLISLSPQNIERGDLWFVENLDAIKKAIFTHSWWRDNALLIEKDLVMKPSLLVRRLMDMGYERAGITAGKGIFAVHGGVIDVWPLNADRPYAIEFVGNTIATIISRDQPTVKIKPRHHSDGAAIAKLAEGSFIVHTDHGIGIYRGQTQTKIQARTDADDNDPEAIAFYKIEYATPGPGREPDILLVPIDQKDRLTPYVGFTTPIIHRLGGALWSRTKRKVREDAEKLARSLFALYQVRHHALRPPYQTDQSLLAELRETFSYTETSDQTRAEQEIMADLARERPMDRILVGDVGFGKTEIAIRAAGAVIASGKQVAILAPTTVLAAQHEKTFHDRLDPLAINVNMLSRLTPPHDEKKILSRLAEGKIDCIIGTSRLLSADIAFKNLGLIIIDEEQRFGVRQKEKCKELRAEVDVLSLSATPIPRTLSLALARLRDISRIDTAPAGRIPIATNVLPHNKKIIRDAIAFEISRGGQVYFLHNRIETIGMMKEKLVRLLAAKAPKSDKSTNVYDREHLLTAVKLPHTPRIGII